MGRCGCTSSCSCALVEGDNVTVTGDGSVGNPYTISATGGIGSQGPQGFQGGDGAQGPQGFQGGAGAQGFQGGAGAQGFQGGAGAQGSQGTQGAQGSQGTQGAQGSQGTQGAQGSQGTQGAQGTPAPTITYSLPMALNGQAGGVGSPTNSSPTYVPVLLREAKTVTGFWVWVGTSAGSVDIALHDPNTLAKVVSTGSTAISGTNVWFFVATASTVVAAGQYILGAVCNSGVATYGTVSGGPIGQTASLAATYPLPTSCPSLASFTGRSSVMIGVLL